MGIDATGNAIITEPVRTIFAPSPSRDKPPRDNTSAWAGEPVRIVVADEHPIFRDGLLRLLRNDERLRIVGETGEESAVATMVRDLCPDILLLGFSSSPRSPVKTLQEIAACGTPVRIILLTGSIDTPAVVTAVQLGAVGVISKESTADVLFKSIEGVMSGHCWVGDSPVSDVASGLRKLNVTRRRTKAFGLTRRELDIVRAVVNGHTNKQIARQFTISESTDKRHITHIFDKLGASNRVEVALFAAHHHVLNGT
jgi:two-component system nitrate/nitrite response regulator NarL